MRYGWSLDSALWTQVQATIAEFAWNRVYLESDYQSRVSSGSGVYLICGSTRDIPINGKVMERLYNVVYAGQTKNLRRRFREHVYGYGQVLKAKDIFRQMDFWYIELSDPNLSEIENLLIRVFGPPANGKYVRAKIGEPVPAGQTLGG